MSSSNCRDLRASLTLCFGLGLTLAACDATPPKSKHDLAVPHDMAVHRGGDAGTTHLPDLSVAVNPPPGSDMAAQANCGNAPPCQGGQACCGGVCLDVTSDPANCGACNAACASGETCAANQCGCGMAGNHCAAPMACCSATCTDITTDSTNCGTCNTVCMGGDTCMSGTCGPAGGGCNPPCAMGQMCLNGACQGGGPQCNPPCAAGQMCLLGALCVPIPCNPACAKNEICDKAVCVPACGVLIKTPCPPPKNCLGGNICI